MQRIGDSTGKCARVPLRCGTSQVSLASSTIDFDLHFLHNYDLSYLGYISKVDRMNTVSILDSSFLWRLIFIDPLNMVGI